jgi:hypothetical protein
VGCGAGFAFAFGLGRGEGFGRACAVDDGAGVTGVRVTTTGAARSIV